MPSKVFPVDACLIGDRVTDGKWLHGQQMVPLGDVVAIITEMEATMWW